MGGRAAANPPAKKRPRPAAALNLKSRGGASGGMEGGRQWKREYTCIIPFITGRGAPGWGRAPRPPSLVERLAAGGARSSSVALRRSPVSPHPRAR